MSGSKITATLAQRPEGMTCAELTAAVGWQPHSVRAALSRMRRAGLVTNAGAGRWILVAREAGPASVGEAKAPFTA